MHCFNSITVQLRPWQCDYSTIIQSCFNSITVQLRLLVSQSSKKQNSGFNSITVQLRPGSQYQTVAINQFQFHNGTIKTLQFVYPVIIFICFNSITVQLRQKNLSIKQNQKLSFNSITVQLRPIKYSKKTSNNKQVIQ